MFGIGLSGIGMSAALKAGRGWHPLDLGSLLVECWDAERADSISRDIDGKVSEWRGLKLGTAPAPTSDIRKPTWNASSFGGSPGVSFNGENSLTLASHPFATGSTPGEIWAVVQQDAGVVDTTQRNIFGYGGTRTRRIVRAQSGGVNRFRGAAHSTGSYVSLTDATTDFSGRHYVRAIFTATTLGIEIDGAQTGPSAIVPDTSAGPLRIGSAEEGNSNFWTGQISFIAVTGILTGDDEIAMREFCS